MFWFSSSVLLKESCSFVAQRSQKPVFRAAAQWAHPLELEAFLPWKSSRSSSATANKHGLFHKWSCWLETSTNNRRTVRHSLLKSWNFKEEVHIKVISNVCADTDNRISSDYLLLHVSSSTSAALSNICKHLFTCITSAPNPEMQQITIVLWARV